MIKIYEDIINNAWLDRIRQEMLYAKQQDQLSYENDGKYYANSYGKSCLEEGQKLLDYFTPMVEDDYGYRLSKENSYSRIYYNGGILNKHVDRESLDITLSLCVYSNIEYNWPLYVDDGFQTHMIETPPGTAGVILGTKYPHWRDKLHCKEGQMVMQVFCHWKILR